MIAFSTANQVKHNPDKQIETVLRMSDNVINAAFKATVDATEEAILNSMLFSKGVKSFNGTYYKSLNEYKELFKELLIEE